MHLKKSLLLLSLVITLGACGSDSDDVAKPKSTDSSGNTDGGDSTDTTPPVPPVEIPPVPPVEIPPVEAPIEQRIIGVWEGECINGDITKIVFGAGGIVLNLEEHDTKTCDDVDPDVTRFVGSYTLSEPIEGPSGLDYVKFDARGTVDGNSSLLFSRERRIIDIVQEKDGLLFLGDSLSICKPKLIPLWKWVGCTSSDNLEISYPMSKVNLTKDEEELLLSESGNEIIAKCKKKGGVLSNIVRVPALYTGDLLESGAGAVRGALRGAGKVLTGDILGGASDFLNIPINIAGDLVTATTDLAQGVIDTGLGTIITGLSFVLERGNIDTDNELGIEKLLIYAPRDGDD